ncbi:hypothetical protein [Methanolobus bombayensis]|uniref:hypothetical protein n=1 Tax=Methanolobus bombayensis TaxID=38023 RepID=UPI001AE464F8|nr:hypothetical protein [Methanolobus bombayensis]MBP1909724.1 hypothetical protein [Methanolobus bombayensis]
MVVLDASNLYAMIAMRKDIHIEGYEDSITDISIAVASLKGGFLAQPFLFNVVILDTL